MISIEDCLIPNQDFPSRYESHSWSRFPAGLFQTNKKGFKTHVKTQLLSPSITYTINLVFWAILSTRPAYVDLKYRLKGETTTSTVYLANVGDDEFHMAELYQFTSDGSIVDLEIDFDDHGINLRVEGILFQPLEIIVYSGQRRRNSTQFSKEGSSSTMVNSVDKNGKKCLTLSARATWVIDDKNSAYEYSNESRFREVRVITAGDKFEIKEEIKSGVLSPETNYASYLVYKLPQDQSIFEVPLNLNTGIGYSDRWYIYLGSLLHTPVIGPNFGENIYRTLNRHKLNVVPRHRSDGWMEVKVWQFETKETPKTVSMHLELNHPCKKDLSGLRIQGIELRPI
nr:hypothetical protein [Tanacetum cinerariifolium]